MISLRVVVATEFHSFIFDQLNTAIMIVRTPLAVIRAVHAARRSPSGAPRRRRRHSTMPVFESDGSSYDEPSPGEVSSDRHCGGGAGSSRAKCRPIYVAATRQHVGKTTTSLALLSGLQKRFDRVGFIKPVGQQCLPVTDAATGRTIRVDKDVVVVREHFDLDHLDYADMSPLVIGPGYTRDYIDGNICAESQRKRIRDGFEGVSSASDVVLCEGTGHCAVGSIVGASNVDVAKMIGADMVLVANGGLGET